VDFLELHSALVIAILGPIFLATGYFYRAGLEKRSNLREALYLLLEIWHRISMVATRSPEALLDTLADRIRVRFPGADFSEAQLRATKAHFSPILRKLVRGSALADVEGLQEAYAKVVRLVARSHPIYAYKLESASRVRRRLAFLDQYLTEAFASLDQEGGQAGAFAAKLRECLNSHAEQDATKELQKGLRGLAWRVGAMSWLDIQLLIRRRRRELAHTSSEEIDQLFDEILLPLLEDAEISAVLASPHGFVHENSSGALHDEHKTGG
jgi:hypothetical protein